MPNNAITITSALVTNPATASKVVIRAVHIDATDKSVTAEFDLLAADGALLDSRSHRFAGPGAVTRVDNMLTFLTTQILTRLGATGTQDP